MIIKTWIANHKALLGSIATALVSASGVFPAAAPYLTAAAIVLAAISGGPSPVAIPPPPPAPTK